MWSQCVWLMKRWRVSARAPELLGQGEPELPDPRAGVEDQDVLAGPDLDARRVAPVEGRGGTGGGDRSPGAPEGDPEPGRGPVGAQALHAGHQLVGIEGLDHVVVGAHRLRPLDVRLVRLRRDHHDDRARQIGVRAQAPEDLEAVHVVHHDVAEDDGGAVSVRQGDAGGPLLGGEDREAPALEHEREEVAETLVVVDDEKGLAGRGLRSAHGHGPATRLGQGGADGSDERRRGRPAAVTPTGRRSPPSRARTRTGRMKASPSFPGIPMSGH